MFLNFLFYFLYFFFCCKWRFEVPRHGDSNPNVNKSRDFSSFKLYFMGKVNILVCISIIVHVSLSILSANEDTTLNILHSRHLSLSSCHSETDNYPKKKIKISAQLRQTPYRRPRPRCRMWNFERCRDLVSSISGECAFIDIYTQSCLQKCVPPTHYTLGFKGF